MLKKLKSNLNWPLLIGMMGLILIVTSGLVFYFNLEKKEKFTIDPEVQLTPDKEYVVTYWDYQLFIGQNENYEEFLQEAIAEFNDMYPNIKVNYKLLSFIEGRKRLKNKLTKGNPPDIYNDIFGEKLLNKKLQIPVSVFLTEKEIDNYNRSGIEAFTYKQQIWGLPNWLVPQVWIGNHKLLTKTNLNLTKTQKQGWTWEDFHQTAQEIKDLSEKNCIIFNPHNPQLFYQLLSMNNSQEILTNNGKLKLTTKNLKSTFEFLDDLRNQEVFYKKPKEMNKKLLPYFWQGKAGVIAPINMWLLNNLYQRESKKHDVKLTLLPVPTNNSKEKKVPLKVTGLTLFRQQKYKGDDHTKAVYKFAKFLSQQKNLYISKKLKVLPAYSPLTSHWKKEVNLRKKLKNQLLTYEKRGTHKKLGGFKVRQLETKIKETINENYEAFWLEGTPITKITENIKQDCKEILGTQKNKAKN